jgi:hypothetical protein
MFDKIALQVCPFMQEPGLLRHADCLRGSCAMWVDDMCAIRSLALSGNQLVLQGIRLLKDVKEVLGGNP